MPWRGSRGMTCQERSYEERKCHNGGLFGGLRVGHDILLSERVMGKSGTRPDSDFGVAGFARISKTAIPPELLRVPLPTEQGLAA